MRPFPLAAVLLSLAPATLAGQAATVAAQPLPSDSAAVREAGRPTALVPGARMRARVGREWRSGRLVRLGPDTIWLAGRGAGAASGSGGVAVALRDAARLEVRRRATRGEGARRWGRRGLVAGLAVGGVGCAVARAFQDPCFTGPRGGPHLGRDIAGVTVFLGGGGAIYGALGGALFRGHRWEDVTVSARR
jgi:hypothetical protein